jgi:hypothetical protein
MLAANQALLIAYLLKAVRHRTNACHWLGARAIG